MLKFSRFGLLGLLLWCVAFAAQAAYITRTITIDGSMADWYDVPPAYTPAGDITNNNTPIQYSNDGQTGGPFDDLDEPIGSTGRDLKKFSFTWDNTYLYFYVERWASATNVTDWWFYIDNDNDGLMESGEDVVRVNWSGANRRTNVDIYDYVWSGDPAVGGDPLTNAGVGDGYTMPGGITNGVSQYTNTVAGATSGTEMESRVTWASLGFGGPANVSFHISSSNGTNLPNNILDNMDGPSGGSLFPQDLVVTKTASETSQIGNQPFSYTVTVANSAIIPFTNVVISDVIPSITTYVSHVAEAGTTFDDSDANTIPDEWNIPSIPSNTTFTLTINVNAGVVPVTMTATNTATITASDQTDVDATNDTDSVDVDITPVPVFTMVKSTSADPVTPGVPFTYTLLVTNTGGATGHAVTITDILSPFTILRMDTYGSSTPFFLNEGTPASGMTLVGATITYSDETSAPYVYDYVPATTGYDPNVRSWKIDMISTMNSSNGNFNITYDVNTN